MRPNPTNAPQSAAIRATMPKCRRTVNRTRGSLMAGPQEGRLSTVVDSSAETGEGIRQAARLCSLGLIVGYPGLDPGKLDQRPEEGLAILWERTAPDDEVIPPPA